MGILNDIAQAINGFFNTIDDFFEFAINPNTDDEQASDVLGDVLEDVQPVDEIGSVLVDVSEEFVQSDLEEAGNITPDEVERVLDEAEGGAAGLLGGLLFANSSFEAGSLGQLDSHEELVAKAVAMFAFEDIAGRELSARLEAGMDPALEAKIRKEHRPRFAALEDHVEASLRTKQFGGRLNPEDDDLPGELSDLFPSDDLNYLANMDVYGTRPDQTNKLALAGLDHLEPEELLEEAPQRGVVPSQQSIDQIMSISGLPEDAKQVFRDLHRQLPKSADMIQEGIRLGDPIFELDSKVLNGVMTPRQAVNFVKGDVRDYVTVSSSQGGTLDDDLSQGEVESIILDELHRRWRLFDSLPGGAPSGGDLQAWFEKGIINSSEFQSLFQQYGKKQETFFYYLQESAIDKEAGAIATQNVLGRISSSEARLQLGLIGYNGNEIANILAGQSADAVIQNRFGQQGSAEALDIALAEEIGSARAASLRAVGIETLGELGDSSVEDLTSVTGMTDNEARTAIESAQRILSQAGG